MDGARIALFEDSEPSRKLAHRYLSSRGHEVVVEAVDLDGALAAVDGIADGTYEVDVILLDGNLGPNDMSYNDARQVAARIQELGVTAVVLGFSTGSLTDHGIEVYADTGKLHDRVLGSIASI